MDEFWKTNPKLVPQETPPPRSLGAFCTLRWNFCPLWWNFCPQWRNYRTLWWNHDVIPYIMAPHSMVNSSGREECRTPVTEYRSAEARKTRRPGTDRNDFITNWQDKIRSIGTWTCQRTGRVRIRRRNKEDAGRPRRRRRTEWNRMKQQGIRHLTVRRRRYINGT